jgi:GntR family transcriptional regulator
MLRGTRSAKQAGLGDVRPLDKESFEPLYFQIQRQLREKIKSGALAEGDPLPGEAEIARLFGVSRMTSRQALQGLTSEGLSFRERGRGTFVKTQKVEKKIAHLLGFSAEMRERGLQSKNRVLEKKVELASPQVAESLKIEVGSNVMMLRRLRIVNDEPIVIEEVRLPMSRFEGLEKINFGVNSLYQVLKERYGVRLASADEVIEARAATKAEAKLLQVAPRLSLLCISRTSFDVQGRPIETGQSCYRSDRYRAVLHLSVGNSHQV